MHNRCVQLPKLTCTGRRTFKLTADPFLNGGTDDGGVRHNQPLDSCGKRGSVRQRSYDDTRVYENTGGGADNGACRKRAQEGGCVDVNLKGYATTTSTLDQTAVWS